MQWIQVDPDPDPKRCLPHSFANYQQFFGIIENQSGKCFNLYAIRGQMRPQDDTLNTCDVICH